MTQYQLGAPRPNCKSFFGLHLYLAERCCENFQSARDPARCKSGPAITWLVGVTIYCTIFFYNLVIYLHLASIGGQYRGTKVPRYFFGTGTVGTFVLSMVWNGMENGMEWNGNFGMDYGRCQNGMEWKISRMEWKTIFHTSIPIPY